MLMLWAPSSRPGRAIVSVSQRVQTLQAESSSSGRARLLMRITARLHRGPVTKQGPFTPPPPQGAAWDPATRGMTSAVIANTIAKPFCSNKDNENQTLPSCQQFPALVLRVNPRSWNLEFLPDGFFFFSIQRLAPFFAREIEIIGCGHRPNQPGNALRLMIANHGRYSRPANIFSKNRAKTGSPFELARSRQIAGECFNCCNLP